MLMGSGESGEKRFFQPGPGPDIQPSCFRSGNQAELLPQASFPWPPEKTGAPSHGLATAAPRFRTGRLTGAGGWPHAGADRWAVGSGPSVPAQLHSRAHPAPPQLVRKKGD